MINLSRRHLLLIVATLGIIVGRRIVLWPCAEAASSEETERKELSVEQWMDEWMNSSKALRGALHVSRFAEPMWFLTQPITWEPSKQQSEYEAVHVPAGFVTDFASIPRPFWSLLRPDGLYTYPAIIHDFLYWTQKYPRELADNIFRLGMKDMGVSGFDINIISVAIRAGGWHAWNTNADLKRNGEKRILARFPDDPTTRWIDWKSRRDVFE